MVNQSIRRTRIWGDIEAVSFLLLVGVAMPLKYVWQMPMAVKIVGWIHGILFVIFCLCLAHTFFTVRWSILRAAMVFIASLIPFGPFLLNKSLKEEEEKRSGNDHT